jgi:hypothetical protein
MIEHGNVSTERFRIELQQCNWGVSPMEFSSDNPRYNRFSLPSKTVRYLAAGLAVISLGHHDSTVVRLARRYDFGVGIDDTNLSRIDDALALALQIDDPWHRYKSEIMRCARDRFDAALMRSSLYSLLGVSSSI